MVVAVKGMSILQWCIDKDLTAEEARIAKLTIVVESKDDGAVDLVRLVNKRLKALNTEGSCENGQQDVVMVKSGVAELAGYH